MQFHLDLNLHEDPTQIFISMEIQFESSNRCIMFFGALSQRGCLAEDMHETIFVTLISFDNKELYDVTRWHHTSLMDQFFSSSDMSSNLDVVADFSTALLVPVIMSHDISRYLFRPETIEGVLLLCNADK
ncbi:hypothetical protein Q3G72_008944 [Acer saccharum]|nr:hypothetical protein Q3G72_008944 [Acer saccharum]